MINLIITSDDDDVETYHVIGCDAHDSREAFEILYKGAKHLIDNWDDDATAEQNQNAFIEGLENSIMHEDTVPADKIDEYQGCPCVWVHINASDANAPVYYDFGEDTDIIHFLEPDEEYDENDLAKLHTCDIDDWLTDEVDIAVFADYAPKVINAFSKHKYIEFGHDGTIGENIVFGI